MAHKGKPNSIKFCYDVVSPYSLFAFTVLMRYKAHKSWESVDVELVPVFLGGIMGGTGNKPPGALPVRARHMSRDTQRMAAQIGVAVKPPKKFPILTLKAMRFLTVVKSQQPDKLEQASLAFWRAFWQDGEDISEDAVILAYQSPIFGKETAEKWIKEDCNLLATKDALNAATKLALDNGAYGAPWWICTSAQGETEPFFGSDRWAHICTFMGLPWYGSDPHAQGADAVPSRL